MEFNVLITKDAALKWLGLGKTGKTFETFDRKYAVRVDNTEQALALLGCKKYNEYDFKLVRCRN